MLGVSKTCIVFEEKKIKLRNTVFWKIKQIVKARFKTVGDVLVA